MTRLRELVVCSLERWDDVWRRNQFLVRGLLERNPDLRVLFVEPPGRAPARPLLRAAGQRLWTLRPVKLAPSRLGLWADRPLRSQVRRAARRLGLRAPVLWVNDSTYAALGAETGWPTLYDVTDDWLLAPAPPRELRRLRRLEERLLREADEIVVCSRALAASRGARRAVTLIPNGVDVEHFQTAQPRPADLPAAPVAVYAGTLHDERLDVELVLDLARARPELDLVFVGPDALSPGSRARLAARPNVHLLGPRPYASLPAYLQHADVLVVPHRVTPFTDSLDPIKAYECVAVGRPTVATPVAGFRALNGNVQVVGREDFVDRVVRALDRSEGGVHLDHAVDWSERVAAFERALRRVQA